MRLLLFCLAVILPIVGYCCEPARDPNSFDHYVQSALDCGVHTDALPYVMKANPDVPKKGTIVLVHGLAGNPLHLHQMAEIFQKKGYNVVVPLLQGHGGDDYMLSTSRLENWKKDVKYAGDIAQQLGPPVFIGGHSTGAALAAIEAASGRGKYAAVFGLDPIYDFSPELAEKAKYACLGSYFSRFETSRLVSYFAGTPHRTFEEQISHIRAVTDALVEKQCGKGFPIPSFNAHYTMSGLCALTEAVDEVKNIRSESLPPVLALKSKDQEFYGKRVSPDEVDNFLVKSPRHEVIQTDAESHQLMTANCSPGFRGYTEKIASWLFENTPSNMVEGNSDTVTR